MKAKSHTKEYHKRSFHVPKLVIEFFAGFIVAALFSWFVVKMMDEQVYNFLIKYI